MEKRGPLSKAQLEQFFEEGFVVVKCLLEPELLERLQKEREFHSSDVPASEFAAVCFEVGDNCLL